MRADVFELIAEELSDRAVSPIYSLLKFEGDRPRLDGASRGKKWDIDREQREFEKANRIELQRLKCRKYKLEHPEYFSAWAREARTRNPEAARAADRERYARNRDRIQARRLAHEQSEAQVAAAKEAKRRWYERNRGRVLAKLAETRAANPAAARARDREAYRRRTTRSEP